MDTNESTMFRAAQWLALAAAVAVLLSIAASQILMALALAALLISGERMRVPRIWLPLAFFLGLTLLSLAFSDDPGDGVAQVRKFYVYLILVLIYSTFQDMAWVRRLVLLWAGAAAIGALRSFVQFGMKFQEAAAAHRSFYEYYVPERITGFMSHWMTFSGQMMFVLLGLTAFLFFSPAARRRMWVWVLCALLAGGAVVLGFTRIVVFGATPAAIIYLVWWWKPKALLALPVLAAVALFASPPWVRARFFSIFQPNTVDSNDFRKVTLRTGFRMIAAHPLLGLGPERVKARFEEFVKDVPHPLPSGWYGHLHNIYVHYAAERGIPAALVLVWMLLQVIWDFLRTVRKLPEGRSDIRFALHFGVAVVIATMVEGLFELNLGDSEVLTMFLAVVACGYVAVDRAADKDREAAHA